MKIWGKYTSLVNWRYWVELPFICKSIVEAWNWKCSHNKWSSQLNVEDFMNINDGLIYRDISWLSLKKRYIIFYFSWPFKQCTCRSSSSDITNYPFPLIDKIPCSASLKKSLMKYLLLHKIFMDLFGLVFWPQDISPCSILVQWSIHRSLVPIVFVLAHCFSPRPANTSQSMLQNRCQYFFCSTCIFYLLLFPEMFRSEVHTFDDMNCTLSIMAFTITTHTLLIQFMFIQE